MKVGLVTRGFSRDENHEYHPVVDDVVRELTRRVDLHLFALRYPHPRSRYELYGAQVHSIGAGSARRVRRLPMLVRTVMAIAAEHRRGRFDLLVGLWIDEPGFVTVASGRLLRVPTSITVCGGELVAFPDLGYGGGLTRSNAAMAALALRGADHVVVGGSVTARQVRHALRPSQHGKIETLYWGIDPEVFDRPAPPLELAGSFRVLHVARLGGPKDQGMLLRAFARLRAIEPGAHLHMVGDGTLRDVLVAQTAALGLTDAVTFHGHKERRDIVSFYRAADVFTLTSRNEGQAVVVLEAALCGLPIVGTAINPIADMAPEAAIAVPIGDDAALAEALAGVREPETRRRLGCAAERMARDTFLAAHTAERLVALGERLNASHRIPMYD
jgi:glycosyltransferase involved in cell wall biosynthesis